MRKFIVPQFIDVESKILGPITARQFVILIVSGIFLFLAYRLFTFNIFLVNAIIIILFGGSLAFLRINGSPFHLFLLNIISSLAKPPLRVWRKEMLELYTPKSERKEDTDVYIPRESPAPGKLSELALIVDTGGMYKGEEEINFAHNIPHGRQNR